ncbi:MAG: transposase [Kiritimatiellia bacterium]
MPDHVHFMIHVRAGEKEPLRQIGQFVANFKRWTKYKVEKLGAVGFGWQANYHDWICSTREGMDAVAKYIKNNPLKWSLMHGANPPLKVIEPLAHDRLPVGEWWSGVGQMALLEGKIAAIRLSRRIPARDYPAVVARLMGACEKGYTLASTFISPCERAVLQELIRREIPFVKMVPDALSMIYRPKEDEPLLFAKGLYLLLSRVAPEGESRYDAWHGINAALAKIAEWNGVSLYVEPAGWRFSPSQGRRSQDSAEPAGGAVRGVASGRESAEPAGGAACGRESAGPAGGVAGGRGSAEPAGGAVGGRGSAEPAGGAACGQGSAEPVGGVSGGRGSAEPAGGAVGGRGSAEPAGGAACGRESTGPAGGAVGGQGSAEPAGGAAGGLGSAEPAGGFVLNGGA